MEKAPGTCSRRRRRPTVTRWFTPAESYWGNVNPIGPRGCYDEAKRFAEALTTAYRTKHGVNTAIMRIFNTYGPGCARMTAARSRTSLPSLWPAHPSPSRRRQPDAIGLLRR